jgi:hypothetical protein
MLEEWQNLGKMKKHQQESASTNPLVEKLAHT